MHPAPSHSPPHAPAISRTFGWVVLAGAAAWMLMVVLAAVTFGAAVWGTVAAIGSSKGATPGTEQMLREALAVGAATGLGALASAVFSLALDVVVTVMSLRRLDGRRGHRAVPVIALIAVVLALVVPVALVVLAVLASLIDLTQITAAMIWLLLGAVLLLAPAARLAQAIAGLVRVIGGEPAPS